jgi:chorismate dehydratase
MRRLRISAISYLNTVPLMWDFEHGTSGADFDISYTVPSACAAALKEGKADIGIIPAAAYTQIPDLVVLPGVAIAARRPVRSILLVSKVPLNEIRTVALDASSMTSVALTKVLFERWLGSGRTFGSMTPDVEVMLAEHDACLVIGDTALRVDRARYYTFDLAEEWIRFTGKPFVFAFWAVRRQALESSSLDLPGIFQNSCEHGLRPENVARIARDWSPKIGISEEDVRRYVTESIHYRLDAGCLEGLQLFYQYAHGVGALPEAPPLHFVEADKLVNT